ncbi:SURF1 family protein [Aliidiomarina maris]|uniref:SURF1-like protein n=1 Tax=Aliidiomarina maris TaxID=531312 RepID=A0A327X2M8_9GAMM|nr:SURF1 family protein [Aliidiomarina maris]MCL5051540.1 SURF1 family protein [Bacillota bacterium]RAJ99143.1 surfeit locus 1 family protein [Aliidiomarina maris]RUO27705.1 hypothetical protein CWE07_03560 [Aliidiomarina maris]
MSFLGLSRRSSANTDNKQFRLHPGACVVTLLAIVILVKLGLWQIDRGQEKQAILDQHASAASLPATDITPAFIEQGEWQQDQRVAVHGQFQSGHYFLIDNQTSNGRVGYHVVALLSADADNQASMPKVPVNLGWVQLPGTRSTLPEITLPEGRVNVEGRLNIPAARPFLLNEQQFSDTLPQRIQYLELASIRQQTGLALTDFSILLDEDIEYGFTRDWPVVISEPHRHYAYAVQWFGLAIAALVVFLVASRRSVPSSSLQETHNNDKK